MVRGQEQIDMSALDKSLEEIIVENKRSRGGGGGRRGGRGFGKGGRGQARKGGAGARGGRGSSGARSRGASGNRAFGAPTTRRPSQYSQRGISNRYNRGRSLKRTGRGGRGAAHFAASNRNQMGANPIRRRQSHPSGARNSFNTQGKVVITNLKKHVSSDDVKEIFEKFGTVTQAYVKFDAHSGASTGTAEVFYSKGAEARQAQKELDGAKIDNGIIRVRLAIPSNFGPRAGFRVRQRGGMGPRRGGGMRGGRGYVKVNPLSR
eukprot:CAMPEP_0202688634 /NCGR_PEP_ID=MMETSP1385-20130828/4122_1 /ASSEMBLY_ACC=CAM_ASM_000861 /TAXON_ID=933848 /ORGANISM="Elphidium margaritaceum" /LENGTH=262 /DNA_ID=CAMNT_0049343653 /DNA_START=99 /DNA_END=887 /DNA_ORIENTATION=+